MSVPRKVTRNVANVVLDYVESEDAVNMFKRLSAISSMNGTVRMFLDESIADIEKVGHKRKKITV